MALFSHYRQIYFFWWLYNSNFMMVFLGFFHHVFITCLLLSPSADFPRLGHWKGLLQRHEGRDVSCGFLGTKHRKNSDFSNAKWMFKVGQIQICWIYIDFLTFYNLQCYSLGSDWNLHLLVNDHFPHLNGHLGGTHLLRTQPCTYHESIYIILIHDGAPVRWLSLCR